MPTAPLVSVVMIFLDPGSYFDEAVASVLDQTMTDLELVLVDDGSTDGSSTVARRWAGRDERVVLLSHPGGANRGTGASRTLGVDRAWGTWVGFLDADDVWEPDHLDVQLSAAAAHPGAGIVVAPARIWVSWRTGQSDHVRHLPYPEGQLLARGSLLDSVAFAAPPIPTCGLLFRKSVVPPDGVLDPTFHGLFEDQTMVARLTAAAPAVAVEKATSRYRQHLDSVVRRSPGRGSRDPATLRYVEWIDRFLRTTGHDTPARAARLAEVRGLFEPRWRFWIWYGARWSALRLVPAALRRRLRHETGATGVLEES